MQSSHRLHYRWSQLEADHSGVNIGSPLSPLPKPDRTLHLQTDRKRSWSNPLYELNFEEERFAELERRYKTIDYNTFCKNGTLKLTEIEIFFLSSKMTKTSSSEWAVVYLGIGTGERFRYVRDEFFPGLTVIGFDPIDINFQDQKSHILENARLWNADGTNFTFHVRGFDPENDSAWIRKKLDGKKLLLISDIRGIHVLEGDGKDGWRRFDKAFDQEWQWRSIQRLCPVCSLLKFTIPDSKVEFFDYAPGVVLKQVFFNYGSREMRLMIDGVPKHSVRYNAYELCEKMMFHHEHMRGQVYETSRRRDRVQCFDNCFDCTVLWETLSTYAAQNNIDPYKVLDNIVKYHVVNYNDGSNWVGPNQAQRWCGVKWYLDQGCLTEAIALLEADGEEDAQDTDWVNIARTISVEQPCLARRLEVSLPRASSRSAFIHLLGSLAQPFTLVRTELNSLIEWVDPVSVIVGGSDQEAEGPSKLDIG